MMTHHMSWDLPPRSLVWSLDWTCIICSIKCNVCVQFGIINMNQTERSMTARVKGPVHSCLRHSSIPITPAIIENETAETIWDAVQRKHPIPLWSLLDFPDLVCKLYFWVLHLKYECWVLNVILWIGLKIAVQKVKCLTHVLLWFMCSCLPVLFRLCRTLSHYGLPLDQWFCQCQPSAPIDRTIV